MSCLLTSGFDPGCQNFSNPGGNESLIYIINTKDITSITDSAVPASGALKTIDSFTLELAADWFAVQVYDTSLTTQESLGNAQSKTINQTVTFTISNFGNATDLTEASMQANNFINQLKLGNKFTVLVQDNAGVWRAFGENGLRVSALEKVSGAASGDLAGTTVTLSDSEFYHARAVSSAYIATL